MKINRILWTFTLIVSILFCGCSRAESVTSESAMVSTSVAPEEKTAEERLTDIESRIALLEEEMTLLKTEAEALRSEILRDDDTEISKQEAVEAYLNRMSLEEKVAQMFVVLPEQLMTGVSGVVVAGTTTQNAINEIPVGGFIYMGQNLQSSEQVKRMLTNVQAYSMERIGLPAFLCVDEEGGTVTRISGTGKFNVPDIGNMCDIGTTGDSSNAYSEGAKVGTYLSELGFNVDFAPVADVLSNSSNSVVRYRSFGSDVQLVSDMSLEFSRGLKENGVYATLKHFPGHGSTAGDTHSGYAYTDKTLDELTECELVPFQKGIENGVSFIMVAHISLPNITGDYTPASLSPYMINDVLRTQMGYDGIVVTDALNMGAVVNDYSSAEAAIMAIVAGVDILLMPSDFYAAYEGVLSAVESGRLTEERIDESLRRILEVKLEMN